MKPKRNFLVCYFNRSLNRAIHFVVNAATELNAKCQGNEALRVQEGNFSTGWNRTLVCEWF